MCIIFSTGYIKIYNLKSLNAYHTQQIMFVHQKLPYSYPIIEIHHKNPCEHPAAGTNECLLIIHSATAC